MSTHIASRTDGDGIVHSLTKVHPNSWECESERGTPRIRRLAPCWWWTDAPDGVDAVNAWARHVDSGPVGAPQDRFPLLEANLAADLAAYVDRHDA